MKNKKKKLTVTLATMMALGTILSGCGGNNNTNTAAEATNTPATATEGAAANSGAPDTSKEVKLRCSEN
jgi:putative aldouronate transport system substrate-binding protein